MLCEENDFDPIKQLVILLENGNDLTKAVACYDLGQFARYHPYGRLYSTRHLNIENRVLDKKGAKDKIIALMETSKNAEIREQALIAVQKILISDWQRIGKSS